jgi:FkbM family methyltransferase
VNLVMALWRNPIANALVKNLRINRLVDAYLARFPIERKTPSGLVYRVNTVPSFVIANEIFTMDVYSKPLALIRPRTFVDLGCNVGYFPLLVAEVMKSRSIKGLCIEPNPSLHPRIEFHLRANGLGDVHALRGVVAGDDAGPEADFFLNPSDIASSLTGEFNPLVPVGGRVQKIRVPVIDLAGEWGRHFGDERIDLLKIDIEGAEITFLKGHTAFLKQVDAVLIEWHSWVTTLEEVSSLLGASGFALESVGHVDKNAGTASFRRGIGSTGAIPAS